MRKLTLLIITLFQTSVLFCQTDKLDLTGLKKKEFKDDFGTIKVRYYDKRDSLLYEVNYDTKGSIINGSFDIAIDKHTYDSNGDRVETRYYDKNMKPVRSSGGPAIIKRKFDQGHRKIEEANYYENGNLVKSNFAVFQFKYNDAGQLIEEIELNDKRVISGDIPIRKYKNDEKGRRIEESLFDKNNRIVKTGGNTEYSTTKFEYSNENRIIKKMFFNERGELIEGKAIIKIEYDKRPPTRTSVDQFDKNPQWILLTYYDKLGNEVDQKYEYIPKREW